jgi:hypothetical protein
MELWKNHRAYILRRFVVVEVIGVIMAMTIPDPHDHLDLRHSLPGLACQDWSRGSANLPIGRYRYIMPRIASEASLATA